MSQLRPQCLKDVARDRRLPGVPDVSAFLFQVVKACNEGVRKMSRTEQMISIQKKMEFKIKVSHASPAPPAGLERGPLARPAERPPLGLSTVPPPPRPSLTPQRRALPCPQSPGRHLGLDCFLAGQCRDPEAACSHL